MIDLILDTASKWLVIGLVEEEQLLDEIQEELKQKQSEYLLPKLKEILQRNDKTLDDIRTIILTDGPGSYTGLRLALTFAKVFALTRPYLKLYTINTLIAYSDKKNGFVFFDARSKRVYGSYIENFLLREQAIYPLSYLEIVTETLLGETSLFLEEDRVGSIARTILAAKTQWQLVEDVNKLLPSYQL